MKLRFASEMRIIFSFLSVDRLSYCAANKKKSNDSSDQIEESQGANRRRVAIVRVAGLVDELERKTPQILKVHRK